MQTISNKFGKKIRLTDEQMKELNISQVGRSHGRPVYEEILECFVDIVKG